MIAGPNGAGKTTLTRHLSHKEIDLGEYINPDDIAAGLTGTLAERTKQAQRIAEKRRDDCIAAKRSFSFETVMSHPSKIEILVRAKEAGYAVLLYFVGTDDPQTNIDRVALRVAQGGHSVPEDKVRDRWLRTMTLLQQAIRSSDRSYIFDNSVAGTVNTVPRLVFFRNATRSGRLPQYELIGVPPTWITRFVLNPMGVNFFDSYARHRTTVGSVVTLPIEAAVQRQSDTIATLTEAKPKFSPHSIEVEQRLLGSILANAETFHQVSGFLEPKHLFEPIHQTIYEALGTLIHSGKIVTLETLRTLLPIDVDIGGSITLREYLERLLVGANPLAKIHEDGHSIYELWLRRELICLGEKIVSAAYDQAAFSPRSQIEDARLQLHALEASSIDRPEPTLPFPSSLPRGLRQFSAALVSAVDSAARAFGRTGSGLSTGFRDVDRMTAGLQPSELIVLASRPGMGKTALVTNIGYTVAKLWGKETEGLAGGFKTSGGVVGFFSLEMSSEQIATRVISQQSRIPISKIRRGVITEREFEIIRDQSVEFQKIPLFIDETTTLSMEQLASRAHRLKREKGLDLLIIDNLELLRIAARTDFGETRSGSLQITRDLKKLAKDLGIPILVLAQLTSKIDRRQDKRPKLDDFNDKGSIEQDADVVMFLHRDDFYLLKDEPSPGSYEHSEWQLKTELAYGKAELIIAKQRNGATGTVELSFDASIGAFGDLYV